MQVALNCVVLYANHLLQYLCMEIVTITDADATASLT